MASVDQRIRRDARRSKEDWVLHEKTNYATEEDREARRLLLVKHDLERLQELLTDEIFNMQERFTRALLINGRLTTAERRILVKHLHTKTFDATYQDHRGADSKNERSRVRIESLLVLCRGDEELLLREYVRALEKFFPVESWSKHYVWNPRLFVKKLKSGKPRTTLRHSMSYRSHVEGA